MFIATEEREIRNIVPPVRCTLGMRAIVQLKKKLTISQWERDSHEKQKEVEHEHKVERANVAWEICLEINGGASVRASEKPNDICVHLTGDVFVVGRRLHSSHFFLRSFVRLSVFSSFSLPDSVGFLFPSNRTGRVKKIFHRKTVLRYCLVRGHLQRWFKCMVWIRIWVCYDDRSV